MKVQGDVLFSELAFASSWFFFSIFKLKFSKKATKMIKSSPSIWRCVVNVKSTVKILSIFVSFLENMNFICKIQSNLLTKELLQDREFQFDYICSLLSWKGNKMVWNCNKIIIKVFLFIKQLLYVFIIAQSFYIVIFWYSLWLLRMGKSF